MSCFRNTVSTSRKRLQRCLYSLLLVKFAMLNTYYDCWLKQTGLIFLFAMDWQI